MRKTDAKQVILDFIHNRCTHYVHYSQFINSFFNINILDIKNDLEYFHGVSV